MRIEWPLYSSPMGAILVAALTLRLTQLADTPKTLALGAITTFSCRIISRALTSLVQIYRVASRPPDLSLTWLRATGWPMGSCTKTAVFDAPALPRPRQKGIGFSRRHIGSLLDDAI